MEADPIIGLITRSRNRKELGCTYGGLHQKSWTALVAALTLISEGGPGTGTLELSPGSVKVDFFWV